MFGWDESEDAYRQTYREDGRPHEAKLSHEILAGGASFAAFKAFEDHQRREGKTVNHQFAKELLAGFAGAEIDKLIETKGMNEYDKMKAKRHSREMTDRMYEDHYERDLDADEYDPSRHPPPPRLEGHHHHHHHDDQLVRREDEGYGGYEEYPEDRGYPPNREYPPNQGYQDYRNYEDNRGYQDYQSYQGDREYREDQRYDDYQDYRGEQRRY